MSNKYDLKMLKRGMETLSNVIGAFAYLMEVGAIGEVDMYNEFTVNDDCDNPQDVSAHIEEDHIVIAFGNSAIMVFVDEISFIEYYDEDDNEKTIFCVKNPLDITNEETFFQASTLYDLNDVDGYEWFTTITDSFAKVMDFMETDNV